MISRVQVVQGSRGHRHRTDAVGDLSRLEGAFERHTGRLRRVGARRSPGREDLARTAAGISGLVAIVQHDRDNQADAHRWFATAAKKISRSITEQFGGDSDATPDEIEAGMLEKSKEFAASENRVYLPLAD